MANPILPYGPQGFADFKAWHEEAESNLGAMRAELERRCREVGSTLDESLAENAPPGLLDAWEMIGEDLEERGKDPTPAAFYCFQLYSYARVQLLAQVYSLELERTNEQ